MDCDARTRRTKGAAIACTLRARTFNAVAQCEAELGQLHTRGFGDFMRVLRGQRLGHCGFARDVWLLRRNMLGGSRHCYDKVFLLSPPCAQRVNDGLLVASTPPVVGVMNMRHS